MTIRVYQDVRGQWRWSLVAGNGRIIADSGEAYATRSNAVRAVRTLMADFHSVVFDPEDHGITPEHRAEAQKALADMGYAR